MRASRRRGSLFLPTVIALAATGGVFLLAARAELHAHRGELSRRAVSAQALALAEGALELARAELARDPTAPLAGEVACGPGALGLEVLERDARSVVVLATGRTDAARLLGPGCTLTRRLRVRLVLGAPGALPEVVAREER